MQMLLFLFIIPWCTEQWSMVLTLPWACTLACCLLALGIQWVQCKRELCYSVKHLTLIATSKASGVVTFTLQTQTFRQVIPHMTHKYMTLLYLSC